MSFGSQANGSTMHLQQEDLVQYGQLILSLASLTKDTHTLMANLQYGLDILESSYSPELKQIVIYALSKPGLRGKVIDEMLGMMNFKVVDILEDCERYNGLQCVSVKLTFEGTTPFWKMISVWN
jgi:hypothetical protein